MSDETTPDGTTPDGAAADGSRHATPRRPGTTPAASAASRARRIGGARPAAASRPSPSQAPSEPAVPPEGVQSDAADATGAPAGAARDGDRGSGSPVVVTQAPGWLMWVPAVVLAGCAVAMAVIVAVSAHGVWYAKPSSASLRDKVLAAAKTCTAAANTYSYTTIPHDEAQGLACSTGKWTGEYRKAMASLVKPIATKLKASQSIQINDAGIEDISSSGRQWTVVVYGQTKITQAGKPGRTDPFSAQVVMQHVDGEWLIAQIDTIAKRAAERRLQRHGCTATGRNA